MKPWGPFPSPGYAGAFVGAIAFFLALPVVLAALGVPDRPAIYRAVPVDQGAYSFIAREIFEKKEDIDVLFLGTSLMWVDVDANYVQRELSRKLGRPAVVLDFGGNKRNEDLVYTLLKDVLAHRKVKLLLLEMPELPFPWDEPHSHAFRWLDPADVFSKTQEPDPLEFRQRISLAASLVLGGPRRLLSLLRADSPRATDEELLADQNLGSKSVKQGFSGSPFVPNDYKPAALAASSMIIPAEDRASYHPLGIELTTYERHFLLLIKELLQREKVRTYVLNLPLASFKGTSKIPLRTDWKRELDWAVPMIALSGNTLFQGVPADKRITMYYNEHLNVNGRRFFTQAITPAVLEAYGR
jgi:hypothetical protein